MHNGCKYNIDDLQKILNISFLYKHNYKISKLSKYTEKQIENEIRILSLNKTSNNHHINSIIISMYSLDDDLFEETYRQQSKEFSFKEIFIETYLPLLNHIGILWQIGSIQPAHEHFVSNLIYQKIALNTASITPKLNSKKHAFVLFLPDGEIHEIDLLYLNYHLKSKGEKTIYLGRSIPFDNLEQINSQFNKITWISHSIIDINEKDVYIKNLEGLIYQTKNKCWVIGHIWQEHSLNQLIEGITFYQNLNAIISKYKK